MGLDMYCMRARKLTESEANKVNGLDLDKIPYRVIIKDKEDKKLYENLKDYLTPVKCKISYWDVDKIKKDFKIPKTAYLFGVSYGSDNTVLSFAWKRKGEKKYKDITIRDEDQDNYTKSDPEDAFVVDTEEIGYWRKAYDLLDEIHDACDERIYNCGYYKVNDKMLKAMQRTGELIGETKDDLFYMEWY